MTASSTDETDLGSRRGLSCNHRHSETFPGFTLRFPVLQTICMALLWALTDCMALLWALTLANRFGLRLPSLNVPVDKGTSD